MELVSLLPIEPRATFNLQAIQLEHTRYRSSSNTLRPAVRHEHQQRVCYSALERASEHRFIAVPLLGETSAKSQ